MLEKTGARAFGAEAELIAKRFVTARRTGEALLGFPGPLPPDLAAAYACQDAAIELVPDTIAGWKVGLIGKEAAAIFEQDRLAGPIFSSSVRESTAGEPVGFPVFDGGFAAVEAEFLLRLGRDAPEGQREWTRAQARELVADVHVGVETAGSPLAAINDLGPTAIVADFGNNAGLIVGPRLRNWRTTAVEHWHCETFVDGTAVGRGHAGLPPGGPFESLRFLLELCARRARPLKAGAWVSTGAITGVHQVVAGQTARVSFGDSGEVHCRAEPHRARVAADAARW
ncbi:MAG TPA: 2-keto-4-pentenoate hydratase [Gammaproteobacteria bacterium]|nr:2-keto-4-pentenoate hydratase [Gammaproteobacteria bacterium]